MSSKKPLAAVAAPIGAAGMLGASLTPYLVLAFIAELIRTPDGELKPASNLTALVLVGLAGTCLLAIGMTVAARQRLQPTPMARACLVFATIAFGLAVLLIAVGNTQLMSGFQRLAMSEQIDIDLFRRGIDRARLPLLAGYISVVGGAVAVFLAGRLASPDATATRPRAGTIAQFLVVGSAILLCLATLWTAYSVYACSSGINQEINPAPELLARNVSGMILSVYLSLFCLAGFCLGSLLWSLAKGPSGGRELGAAGLH